MFSEILEYHTDSEVLLLSKFLRPNILEHYENDLNWKSVLGEPPKNVIRKFINTGQIVEGDLYNRLDWFLTIPQIKKRFKLQGLMLTGNKSELLERLLENDFSILENEFKKRELVYICSPSGSIVAKKYKDSEEAKYRQYLSRLFVLLEGQKFDEAYRLVCDYEIIQVFPRNLNKSYWIENRTKKAPEAIKIIFTKLPKILNENTDIDINKLRIRAGMLLLLGKSRLTHVSLPPEYNSINSKLEINAAARMILFYANIKLSLDNFKKSGITKVRVFGCEDSCDSCREIEGMIFDIENAMELPYYKCNHKYGCRCSYLPV